jgi:hypothetical protein
VLALLERADGLGLDCELNQGDAARHAVCMSCNGDPRLRKLAYRWYQAAPPGDDAIEFHPHRIAAHDPMSIAIGIDGLNASIADLRFDVSVDSSREKVDLVVKTPDWPQETREAAVFLALDAILGEVRVERWIGRIEFADRGPTDDGLDAVALAQKVATLDAAARNHPAWAILQKVDKEGRMHALVSVRRPLKPIDFPLFDHLVRCHSLVPADADGSAQLGDAQRDEEELSTQFAGRALHAASITTSDHERTALFYVDSDQSTGDELENAARSRGFHVDRYSDPEWKAVRPFR